MSAVATAQGAVTIASDLGVQAAAELDRSLASFTSTGMVEAFDPAIWQALDSGGWLAAGESAGGDGLQLLDLIELAVVWGKHLIPAPYLETLIARRHLGASAPASSAGYTFALVAARGALAPFGGLPGCTFLARLAPGHAATGAITASEVDDFAPSLPLAASPGSAVGREIVREAIVLRAAEMIGLGETLLRRTVDFANIRKAYGQEIAKFQAIRFRLADVHCDIEAMRGLVVAAANEPDLTLRAARLAVRSARKIAEACIQTHGAIGFTWDLGLHRFLRHAMAADRLLTQYAALSGPDRA